MRAFLFIARLRRKREQAMQLSTMTNAARGEVKEINAMIRRLQD